MATGIKYTFPADCAVKELAGKTVYGGVPTMFKGEEQVVFATRIAGREVRARVIGKPELAAAVAAYKADLAGEKAAHDATPRGQRDALAVAEYNSYDPDAFPGSVAWRKHAVAVDALEAFDAAHPDLVTELNAERQGNRDAAFTQMSDFVKSGS